MSRRQTGKLCEDLLLLNSKQYFYYYRLKLKEAADERKAEGEEGEVEKKIKLENTFCSLST